MFEDIVSWFIESKVVKKIPSVRTYLSGKKRNMLDSLKETGPVGSKNKGECLDPFTKQLKVRRWVKTRHEPYLISIRSNFKKV